MTDFKTLDRRRMLATIAMLAAPEWASAGTARSVYVSSSQGSDLNDGRSADKPYRSLARAAYALDAGVGVYFRSGDSWGEMLEIRHPRVSISSFGSGPRPQLMGDGRRHGLLIRAGNVSVKDVAVRNAINGIYVTGAGASADIENCLLEECGSGIVSGGAGRLARMHQVTCLRSTLRLGAGDGVQISEDASAEPCEMTNSVSSDNDKSGINHKIGTVSIKGVLFERNGECGVLSQIHARGMDLINCVIRRNNRADNGTFNMALEDRAIVRSFGNSFEEPFSGKKTGHNIQLSGASRLQSRCDQIIETDADANTGASIRLATGDEKAELVLQHASIFRTGKGRVVDAYGATALTMAEISNCAIDAAHSALLRTEPGVSWAMSGNAVRSLGEGSVQVMKDRQEHEVHQIGVAVITGDVFDGAALEKGELKIGSGVKVQGVSNANVRFDRDGRPFGDPPQPGCRT